MDGFSLPIRRACRYLSRKIVRNLIAPFGQQISDRAQYKKGCSYALLTVNKFKNPIYGGANDNCADKILRCIVSRYTRELAMYILKELFDFITSLAFWIGLA